DRPRAQRGGLLLGIPGRDRRAHIRDPVPALVLAAITRTPGWGDWSLDPALALMILTGLLYRAGGRRTPASARVWAERRRQSACFYCGLAVLAFALDSPLDAFSQRLFWAHMV